jgi:hypothetical protein
MFRTALISLDYSAAQGPLLEYYLRDDEAVA